MAAPPPDLSPASRWRTVALALAVACAALSGLLLLTVTQQAASASKDDAGQGDASADQNDAAAAAVTRGRIEGVIQLSGKPPLMPVPPKRKDAELCKSRPMPGNAVIVNDGLLKDVLVRIESGGIKGDFPPPDARVTFEHVGCMYSPRIQGAMVGQELEIKNSDPVLHNIHETLGQETLANIAQPKGAEAAVRMLDASGIYKLTCDVHPWERGFVVVSDHPFFAVTGDDGAFAISDVPVGSYTLEAWHARYGLRRIPVEVGEDTPAVIKLTYEATDPEPELNRGELDGPF